MIRHNDAEWARVQAMAEHLGVSRPALYERALLAGSVQAAAGVEEAVLGMIGARRLLANAANNLNQIARAANSGERINTAQLESTLALFATAIAELRDEIANLHRFVPGIEEDR
ncbi:mobilisation protein (MobC) [Nocardioides sp. YR527]|uniref:plasmid mobilization relaxosome protein MobC n=1 Tax=Nocardioides sp. YR527 TaxID=1881028 RepID=UPI00088D5918|nr:plasmid mobilization relaxosome protein MobC [Nocardioides sp. YR527]SDL33929.1 mobilisation protein (MobC) [Nocardioides sp. YR527]